MKHLARLLIVLATLFVLPVHAGSGGGGVSLPDPYLLWDTNFPNWNTYTGYRSNAGLTVRSSTINPAVNTLVLLVTGQSLLANVVPTLHLPTNASVIDNFNVYDGQLYNINGPLVGASWNPAFSASLGPGNVATWLADNLIGGSCGTWSRVILVPLAMGSSFSADWAASGVLGNRVAVAMKRLAALGITPGMTGVTFALLWGQGYQDYAAGTSQATQTVNINSFISTVRATSFGTGRIFIALNSVSGQTSNAIRSAEAATWNSGQNIYSGGDMDSATIGTSDGVHPSDAGAPTMANIFCAAFHASGAPF